MSLPIPDEPKHYYDDRKDFYDKDSWRMFEVARRIQLREGKDKFLPDPYEINERKRDVDWLKAHGFGQMVIRSVLVFEAPPMSKVRKWMKIHKDVNKVWRLMRHHVILQDDINE